MPSPVNRDNFIVEYPSNVHIIHINDTSYPKKFFLYGGAISDDSMYRYSRNQPTVVKFHDSKYILWPNNPIIWP